MDKFQFFHYLWKNKLGKNENILTGNVLKDVLSAYIFKEIIKIYTAYKVFVLGVILVRIFPSFSRIRTEYGEILRISLDSVRMWENAGKMRTRITPNTDTFYAVIWSNICDSQNEFNTQAIFKNKSIPNC